MRRGEVRPLRLPKGTGHEQQGRRYGVADGTGPHLTHTTGGTAASGAIISDPIMSRHAAAGIVRSATRLRSPG